MRLLVLATAFLLAACGTDSPEASGGTASSTAAPGGTASAPVSTASASGASGADCLVGTWQIDPESMDLNKVEGMENMPNAEFSVGGSSGRALLAFEASGEAMQTFEEFSITINADVMGQTIRVRNDYSGTAAATYAIEDGWIVMTPGEAALSSSVSVNGGAAKPNPFATESVFEEMERGKTDFECEGDVLSLDIHEPDMDGGAVFIRDIRYTRVAS